MFDRFYPPSPPEDTQSLHPARIPRPSGHFQRWEEKTPESADSRDPGFSWWSGVSKVYSAYGVVKETMTWTVERELFPLNHDGEAEKVYVEEWGDDFV